MEYQNEDYVSLIKSTVQEIQRIEQDKKYINIIRDLLLEIEANHTGESRIVNKHILETYGIDLFCLIELPYETIEKLASLSWEETYEQLGEIHEN